VLESVSSWSTRPLLWGYVCLHKWSLDLISPAIANKSSPESQQALAQARAALKSIRAALLLVCTGATRIIKGMEGGVLNMCPLPPASLDALALLPLSALPEDGELSPLCLRREVCWSVLECVGVCCSVLECGAGCCSVW